MNSRLALAVFGFFLMMATYSSAQEIYQLPENTTTGWSSFENPKAEKAAGGKENRGAKGHAFNKIKSGEEIELLNIEGSGVVNRIWMTFSDRSPEMLRSLVIEMYWDKNSKPAVSVPIGDFFGIGLGKRVPFESVFFTDPEGRSFNCYIPMPFKTGAKIVVRNESDKDLDALFFDVNFNRKDSEKDVAYFHAYWNRDTKTKLGKDFEILPKVSGKGRFLGTNIGVKTAEGYEDTWFGEGEVKMYIDGDSDYPSLIGSGTEDYIGTAYGQGSFSHQFQGSPLADSEKGIYAFYRYHNPDPVYFYEDIRVTIQQIGGAPKKKVLQLIDKGVSLEPITIDAKEGFIKLLEGNYSGLGDPELPDGWTNFYRSDDVSATAYFYLNKPVSNLPSLPAVTERIKELE